MCKSLTFNVSKTMSRGGLRANAGRPRGAPKLSVLIRLRTTVADELRTTIPERSRSAWIEDLIVNALAAGQRPNQRSPFKRRLQKT